MPVRTRNIINTPVNITESPARTMMVWYILFSSGYLAKRRGAGALFPVARRHLLEASSMSILSGQMDQKSMKKLACTM